jgi:hypothetical protein
VGLSVGLKINRCIQRHQCSSERTVERDLETVVLESKKMNKKLQLILVVLPCKVGYEGISLVEKCFQPISRSSYFSLAVGTDSGEGSSQMTRIRGWRFVAVK